MATCIICGRKITTVASRHRKMGLVCWYKHCQQLAQQTKKLSGYHS